MNILNKKIFIWVAALALPANFVYSDVIIPIDTYYQNYGAVLPTTTPWLSATLSQAGSDVSLTLSAPGLIPSSGFNLSNWFFSYSGFATSMTFTPSTGNGVLSSSYFGYSPGSFNVQFYISPTLSAPLTVLLSANIPLLVSDFIDVPHSFGTITANSLAEVWDNTTNGAAYIINSQPIVTPPVSVPEPMTYLCLATLLTIVAIAGRRKFMLTSQ